MRIFILGAGKMGAWLTEEFCLEHEVAVYDRDLNKLKFFFETTRFSRLEEVKDFKPELAINCATIQKTREAFEEMVPFLPEDCILADIKSIKGDLPEYYSKQKQPFVSIHPMFGPTFANLKDLKNQNAILITESCQKGLDFFRDAFQKVNLNIFEMSFAEHDEMMSYSLSIPFASSMVFAACMNKREAPGTTYNKHLDIAEGLFSEDDWLIAEIMFNDLTLQQIDKINNKLNYLRHIIKSKDYEEMTSFLNSLRRNINQ